MARSPIRKYYQGWDGSPAPRAILIPAVIWFQQLPFNEL
jgi:hypothetical protein